MQHGACTDPKKLRFRGLTMWEDAFFLRENKGGPVVESPGSGRTSEAIPQDRAPERSRCAHLWGFITFGGTPPINTTGLAINPNSTLSHFGSSSRSRKQVAAL